MMKQEDKFNGLSKGQVKQIIRRNMIRVKAVNAIGTSTASSSSSSFVPVEHDPSGFFPIATYTVSSATASSITFSNIPQNYTHLQLRCTLRNTTTGSNYATININSGTYRQNFWYTSGSGYVVSTSTGADVVFSRMSSATANYFGSNIMEIDDYSSTTRNKVVRSIGGAETTYSNSTGGNWAFSSLLSMNTAAVSTVTITPSSGNFAQWSQATLYAWK